jgi:hypothetical protein
MQRWTTPTGSLEMWYPAPRLVADRIVGHLDLELARHFTSRLTIKMAQGPLQVFSNWEQMEGYDSNVRVELTTWALQHRRDFASIHVLVRSKLVAMGISVANVALGGLMRPHTRRVDYEAAYSGAVSRVRSATLVAV